MHCAPDKEGLPKERLICKHKPITVLQMANSCLGHFGTVLQCEGEEIKKPLAFLETFAYKTIINTRVDGSVPPAISAANSLDQYPSF